MKQYFLLFSSAHHQERVSDELVEEVIAHVSGVEEVYEALLYQTIYSGISSIRGMKNLSEVLLNARRKNTQLLAMKLVTSAVVSDDSARKLLALLSNVFEKSSSDWLKKQVLLAKMAVAINSNASQVCQNIAHQYISTFERDIYFPEIYELLAYLSVDEEVNEYRLSAHHLDKLRVSAADVDAFFNNHDYKLASEMYDEVLTLDK